MERKIHNPWTWQDDYGFVQANETVDAERTLHCAGQTSVDQDGAPLHAGDIGAQALTALDNLEAVLASADMTLADVVRLNLYTTDVDGLMANMVPLAERLAQANCRYAGTLLGVQRLAFPQLLIEIEATAVA